MPARSFARRTLIPARATLLRQQAQAQQLGFFTSSSLRSSSSDDASTGRDEGVRIAQTSSTSGSTLPPSLPASYFTKAGERLRSGRSSSKGSSRHPLVLELVHELYTPTPSPERVWRAYVAIHTARAQGGGGAGAGSVELKPAHHVQVLRALAPDVGKRRKLKRDNSRRLEEMHSVFGQPGQPFTPPPAPQRTQQHTPAESHAASGAQAALDAAAARSLVTHRMGKEVSSTQRISFRRAGTSLARYIQRVDFVFAQMEQTSAELAASSLGGASEKLPRTADFNHVLEVIAPGGHIAPLTSLWAKLVRHGEAAKARRAHADANAGWFTSSSVAAQMPAEEGPSLRSYTTLMLGLSRHLSHSIERAHKAAMRSFKSQLSRASTGAARYAPLPPSARNAALLAARRAIGILDDMWARQMRPDQLTLDLAARMLRLAGHTQGLHTLLKVAYGVDLANPDARLTLPEWKKREEGMARMSTHTLNTVLMTMGEHETVGKMIAAYETLVRPLPLPMPEPEPDAKGLFKLDWSALSSRSPQVASSSDEAAAPSKSSAPFDADAYVHAHSIQPNTTTFTHLIRHACVAPTTSTLVSLRTASGLAPAAAAEEIRRRKEHLYAPVAQYLAREMVERYEGEVRRMAKELGVWCPDLPAYGRKRKYWEHVARQKEAAGQVPASLPSAATAAGDAAPAALENADAAPFVPHLNPPHLAPSPELFLPFLGIVGKLYSAHLFDFAVVLLRRAKLAREAEVLVLSRARERWGSEVRRRQEARTSAAEGAEGEAEDAALPLPALKVLLRALNTTLRTATEGASTLSSFHATKSTRLSGLREARHGYNKRRTARQTEAELLRTRAQERERREKIEEERTRRAMRESRAENEEQQGARVEEANVRAVASS